MYMTNKYQQLKHEIRKLLIKSRGAFLIGMCGHWIFSKCFEFVCVVVKNNSNNKPNKIWKGEKVMFMKTNGFDQLSFSYIILDFEFCCWYCWTAIFSRRSHLKVLILFGRTPLRRDCSVQLKGWWKVLARVLWLYTSQPFRVINFPHLCLRRSCSWFCSGPKASGRVFMCWLCFVPIHNCVIL